MNSFQTIVLGVFGFFIIAGLIVISLVKVKSGEGVVHIALWGAAPSAAVRPLIADLFDAKKLAVSYTEQKADELDTKLIEALAAGRGPDLVLLPAELLARYRDKIVLIPFANISERQFKDAFVQEADIFLAPEGILALPFSLDPLVMYWNRDLLDEAGVSTAPKFWDEFLVLAKELSARDEEGNLARSAVGLGEYRNISSAREIIGALLLQAPPASSGDGVETLGDLLKRTGAPAAISFYTEFANPEKPVYSWNRSLKSSRQEFLASRLAVYFGFGSEYAGLKRANPNLNFDAGLFPRPRNSSVGTTYGRISGLAVLRASRSPSVALQVAQVLSASGPELTFAEAAGLPPARRDLLGERQTDAFRVILYDAANRSRGFIDPNPVATAAAFQEMIESVTSGRARSEGAVSHARSVIQ